MKSNKNFFIYVRLEREGNLFQDKRKELEQRLTAEGDRYRKVKTRNGWKRMETEYLHRDGYEDYTVNTNLVFV